MVLSEGDNIMTNMVDVDAIRSHVQTELKRWQVPAVELVAVHQGDVVLADAFGFRDWDARSPASPHTLFHHGSTGKAFTGVLAGTLVDAGLLDWDRPVGDYLPDFRLPAGMLGHRISTADLLSHRSGLARHEFAWVANPSLDRGELVRRLRYLPSNIEPRTRFVYSNLGYVTVGHLVAVLTGSTWEDQMRERVLQPLGMSRTHTSVDHAHTLEHAQPYVLKAHGPGVSNQESESGAGTSGDVWSAIPWRQSDQIAPAGGIITCAVDTVRWLQLQLSDGEVDGKCIISAESLARTRRLHTPIDAPGPDPDIWFYGYAFGWLVGTFRGRRLLWHNGGIDGFKTEIAVLPGENIAVAASCNVLDSDLPLSLVFHMIDSLLDEEPKPWSQTFLAARRDRPAPIDPEHVEVTHPSHHIESYAGHYVHPGYGTLQVEVQDGEMHTVLGELEMTTRHRHYDTWTIEYEPLESSFTMTFLTNADGKLFAVELDLEPSMAPLRFEIVAKETDE
jgi:CubicO group peptidase (beta-lactamase class C family)